MKSSEELLKNLLPTVERFETYGDFVVYFSKKTGLPKWKVGEKLKGRNDMKTLFYIKSVCDKNILEGKKDTYLHAFNSCLYTKDSLPIQSSSGAVGANEIKR